MDGVTITYLQMAFTFIIYTDSTDLWIDEEWDPADHNEETGGEIVGDHVEGGFPGEDQLEAGHWVVHAEGCVARVLGVERVDFYVIVQDGPDGLLFCWYELISITWYGSYTK